MEILFFAVAIIVGLFFLIKYLIKNKFNKLLEKYKQDSSNNKFREKTIKTDNISFKEYEECVDVISALEKLNFEDFIYYLKKVLQQNPKNYLALTLTQVNFDFDLVLDGEAKLLTFDISPIETYIEKYSKNIPLEVLTAFSVLLINNSANNKFSKQCYYDILSNTVYNFTQKSDYLKYIYILFNKLKYKPYINEVQKALNSSKGMGLKSFILTNNEYLAAYTDGLRDELKYAKKQMVNSRKLILETTQHFIENLTMFTKEEIKIIINEFKSILIY